MHTTHRLALLFSLFACYALGAQVMPVPAHADARIGVPQVLVSADQPDWTYATGDPVTFTVMVLMDGQLLPGAVVSCVVGPEKFEAAPVELTLPHGVTTIEAGTLEVPGFLRCSARTQIGGKTYTGMATAAFDPGRILPTQADPEDFDAFWSGELAALRDLPLDLDKKLLPQACTPEVNVYSVSYQTPGNGGPTRFYGILAEPAKPGKYPAVLRVPGAGVRPYSGGAALAAKGLVVLDVGIHGIPVQMEGPVYDDLRAAGLYQYWSYNLDNRDLYYYRRVYLGCYRGNDVLVTHPMWDGKTLVVCGGSQGGQLSIVTSALDARVTGTVSNYPAYCDVTGYLHGRAGGWPHVFSRKEFQKADNISTSAYYDAVNFARRLRAPVSFAWGYNDVTCPPTSMYAAYNVVTAPRELHLQLDMGHGSSAEFNDAFNRRVLKMAGIE